MATNHIVKSYDNDLEQLKATILSMTELVQNQFKDALLSLQKMDKECAQAVMDRDNEIDQLEAKIDQLALQILALRQPVAFDLRMVIAILKMANHLERMGDYATNISRRILVLDIQSGLLLDPPDLLFRMGDLIHEMMVGVWHGFQTQDKEVMEKTWEQDREVDKLYNTFLRELLTYMIEDPRRITLCTHYLFIAKNIERIGDHTTNLSEIVAIMVRGKPLKQLRRYSLEGPTAPPPLSQDPFTP